MAEKPKLIAQVVKDVLLQVQRKARESGHLGDDEQVCFHCGAVVMGEDLGDHPCIDYGCECGHSWCDTGEWVNRAAMQADNLRKQQKENGL